MIRTSRTDREEVLADSEDMLADSEDMLADSEDMLGERELLLPLKPSLTAEEMAAAAADLRVRFLDRLAAARACANTVTPSHDGVQSQDSLRHTLEDDHEAELLPSMIGRYRIVDRLGVGGMGVVYAAYDEALDRRLAIKVLHGHVWDASGRRRERLLREAQAMAKVTHPNLVTVHEVGTANGQLFVAMEFVPGPTLERWLVLTVRSWRDVVAVFRQIAEGLAALHDAGLVHRDVKPANLIIGDDRRARVLDLGLVGIDPGEFVTTENAMATWSSSLSRVDHSLTKTGDRLGTPAYMSPEQFLRQRLTPASDMFSLCVTLYEALYGVHPFLADTFDELRDNVVAGRIAPPVAPSNVPSWLHALVMRGLTSNPADRPSSMLELAAALAKDPTQVRRRWFGTLALAASAAIGGVALASTSTELTPCDGGATTIAAVWDEARAGRVRAALSATELPYAAPLADRLVHAFDDYAESWADAHRRICLDHVAGHTSAALLDARMACLDRRRQALAETVTLLADADVGIVEHAGDMIAKLPRLEACDDLVELNAHARFVGPQIAQTNERLEADLVRGAVLANAGLIDNATEITRSVAEEAKSIGQPHILARALLTEVRASILLQRDLAATSDSLERALAISVEHGLDELAAEAMILRLYVHGLSHGGSDGALADVSLAEAMLARAGGGVELRALLLNNRGAVELAAGDRASARISFERSLSVREELFGGEHLELAPSLINLSLLTTDDNELRELHERIVAIYEAQLGPEHPRTLDARLLTARQITDPELVVATLVELCPHFLDIDAPQLSGECEFERGRREYARGRIDFARRDLLAAQAHLGTETYYRPLLDAYINVLDGGEPAPAELRKQAEQLEIGETGNWWFDLAQAERRLLLAQMFTRAGDQAAAIATLERGIVELERIDGWAPLERDRLLALSRTALALALDSDSAEPERVAELASAARAYYARWAKGYEARLAQLDSLDSAR